jgi:hypothetical protein
MARDRMKLNDIVLRGEIKEEGMDWPYCMHGRRAMHTNDRCAIWREDEIGKDFKFVNELSGFIQEEE